MADLKRSAKDMRRAFRLLSLLALILSGCVSVAQRDGVNFTPTKLSQAENGFVGLTCEFAMYGPRIEYVVIHGMNQVAQDKVHLGEADSAAVEIFIAGAWRSIPDQRWCGTSIGVFHFVPEPGQRLYFGVMNHRELREFLLKYGDPGTGVLVRAIFSIDVIRPGNRVEPTVLRSAVSFARIGHDGLHESWPTLYTPETAAEAEDLLSRMLEEPNQSPQRNAGSRPSSDDSPASGTPSSLGPRG